MNLRKEISAEQKYFPSITSSKYEGYPLLQFSSLYDINKEPMAQLVLFFHTLKITLQLLSAAVSTLKRHLCLRTVFFII